jgi:hypothetical protein
VSGQWSLHPNLSSAPLGSDRAGCQTSLHHPRAMSGSYAELAAALMSALAADSTHEVSRSEKPVSWNGFP